MRRIRLQRIGLAILALLAAAPAARAGLLGVDEIRIYSAIPDYLQVGELIATQTGTGTDVALASQGSTATATSEYAPGQTVPGNATNGLYPASYPDIWHSATSSSSEYLQVVLAGPSELSSVTVYGRGDCCQSRDIYDIYLYDASHTLLYTSLNADARTAGYVMVALPNTAIPEPTALAPFLAGLLGLALRPRYSSGSRLNWSASSS